MINEKIKLKNVLLIAVPCVIIIAAIILMFTFTLGVKDTKDINISISSEKGDYILGKAEASRSISDPTYIGYRFKSKDAKNIFIDNNIKNKNIIDTFFNAGDKVYLWVDNNEVYGIVDTEENLFYLFYSITSIVYNDTAEISIIEMPMLHCLYSVKDELTANLKITIPYNKIYLTDSCEKYRTYEDFKNFYVGINKQDSIARFDDDNKTIEIKGRYKNIDRETIGHKVMKLFFGNEGITVENTGKDW